MFPDVVNGKLKSHHTYYKQKGLAEFKIRLLEIVRDTSMEYVRDKQPYKSEITISSHMTKEALKYDSMKNFIFRKGENEKAYCYMTAGNNSNPVTEAMVDGFLHAEYESFDDFIEHMFDLYVIIFDKDPSTWKTTAQCSCPAFSSNFICKYLVTMAYKLKLLKKIEKTPLGANASAGRPAKVQKGRPLQKD